MMSTSSTALILLFALAGAAQAAETASPADKAFVGKVSQGGMFEVEASKLAERRAVAQDVKDQATTEVHDHTLVGAKLKATAAKVGLTFPATLDAAFKQRLAGLEKAPEAAFDQAYLAEMETIHDADGAAFADEAKSGADPGLKAFAAETDLIVERHIGALHAVPLPAK